MKKVNFAKGIERLNAYYVNFKVDLDNQLVLEVWYEALKYIDDESFDKLIKDYCIKNVYAPQSPTHLIEWFDKLVDAYLVDLATKTQSLENKHIEYVSGTMFQINYNKAIENETDPVIIELLMARKNGKIKYLKTPDIERYLFNRKHNEKDKTLFYTSTLKLEGDIK